MRSSSSVQYYGIAGASSQRLREEEGFSYINYRYGFVRIC